MAGKVRWIVVVSPQGHLKLHKGDCPHTERSTERILLEQDRQLVDEVRDARARGSRIDYCKNCLDNWPGPVRDMMSRHR